MRLYFNYDDSHIFMAITIAVKLVSFARKQAVCLGTTQLRGDTASVRLTLSKKQAIQFPLVDLYAEGEMVRHFNFKSAWPMDRQDALESSDGVSICNFWASRLACEAADRALQTHGGNGYSRALPFEPIYRQHRRYRFTKGCGEVQMRRVAQ